VAKDKNNINIANSNTKLVDEDILAISVIPIKKKTTLDSIISVD
jgi:hypothetical protein